MSDDMIGTGAHFSADRVYRYALWRRWDEGTRDFVVIGLNPSTADESIDDPTIRRCIGFAKRERCVSLVMLNLFAFRSTDPRRMRSAADPIGSDNDEWIRFYTGRPWAIVVAAWGVHGAHLDRARFVTRMVNRIHCLGRTKDGHPRHPLYLRADTPRELFA